jgi:hypothetical protein
LQSHISLLLEGYARDEGLWQLDACFSERWVGSGLVDDKALIACQ